MGEILALRRLGKHFHIFPHLHLEVEGGHPWSCRCGRAARNQPSPDPVFWTGNPSLRVILHQINPKRNPARLLGPGAIACSSDHRVPVGAGAGVSQAGWVVQGAPRAAHVG